MTQPNDLGQMSSYELINMFLRLSGKKPITIPVEYRDQVLAVKKILKSDVSGFVNSTLDYASSSATTSFAIESSNSNLRNTLSKWINNVNRDIMGVTSGLRGLAKEYFRERWQGSSFLVLRTFWNEVNGIELPTVMYFADGSDIKVKNGKSNVLGEEKYSLIIDNKKTISLPSKNNEMLFINKPYESWGSGYPTPFIIKRGIYKNLSTLDAFISNLDQIIYYAIPYLMQFSAGDPELLKNNFGEPDLKQEKENFDNYLADQSRKSGMFSYFGSFDKKITHLVPPYKEALVQELINPMIIRILAGLGIVEMLHSSRENRRENIISAKPFRAEVITAADDFISMMNDVIYQVIVRNRKNKRKYFSSKTSIILTRGIINDFFDDRAKNFIRGVFDRGVCSLRTYCEISDLDYEVEKLRREEELKNKDSDLMKPHPARYLDLISNNKQVNISDDLDKNENNIPEDKVNPTDKKNYKNE